MRSLRNTCSRTRCHSSGKEASCRWAMAWAVGAKTTIERPGPAGLAVAVALRRV
ncbi:MAG TPA: CxxxxCH/CxxCH domain-containing protein [Anaerolineae bacterium]|nr:CxxxxCH/CxxCH domain-containing protein [Anaerolineae bacterium]